MDGGAWWAAVHGVAKSWTRLSDVTFIFHLHALEKEMATHSSVLAWRIPGTGEPGGLPSMGLHRVGHDCSDLAVAAATDGECTECSPHTAWVLSPEPERSVLCPLPLRVSSWAGASPNRECSSWDRWECGCSAGASCFLCPLPGMDSRTPLCGPCKNLHGGFRSCLLPNYHAVWGLPQAACSAEGLVSPRLTLTSLFLNHAINNYHSYPQADP